VIFILYIYSICCVPYSFDGSKQPELPGNFDPLRQCRYARIDSAPPSLEQLAFIPELRQLDVEHFDELAFLELRLGVLVFG
jgi:hypothetical protein